MKHLSPHQHTSKYCPLLALGAALTIPTPAHAAGTLMEAITYGTVSAQLRYRYENVDQEGINKNANASTLRTQLGYGTDSYLGFNAFLQVENVSVIGAEHYNSGSNGLTRFPLVADPEGTEINQVILGYEAGYGTSLKYGRQAINLDNQRFIGTVGWRQNEQTFDAFSVVNTTLPDTTATYAHVNNVNRIFGEDHPNLAFRNTDMSSELLNVAYKGLPIGTLVGYGYFLEFDNAKAASQKSLGLRLDGNYRLNPVKLLYTAEYADQSDYADGASTVDADYQYAALGLEYKGVQVRLNYEVLSGDGVYGFATPLATLHAFNGWADKFLNTPADGIVDAFVSVGGTAFGLNLMARYHDFSADHMDYDYGDELDLLISKKVNKYLTLMLKYATYGGDENAVNVKRNVALSQDLDKVWLQAEFVF